MNAKKTIMMMCQKGTFPHHESYGTAATVSLSIWKATHVHPRFSFTYAKEFPALQ
jgi:hypothetical protein